MEGGSPSGDYRESALKIKLSEKVKKIADRAKKTEIEKKLKQRMELKRERQK
jgi:hypothetical protein